MSSLKKVSNIATTITPTKLTVIQLNAVNDDYDKSNTFNCCIDAKLISQSIIESLEFYGKALNKRCYAETVLEC